MTSIEDIFRYTGKGKNTQGSEGSSEGVVFKCRLGGEVKNSTVCQKKSLGVGWGGDCIFNAISPFYTPTTTITTTTTTTTITTITTTITTTTTTTITTTTTTTTTTITTTTTTTTTITTTTTTTIANYNNMYA